MKTGWRRASVNPQTLPPTLAATLHSGWGGEGMKRQESLTWAAVNKQIMCLSDIDDDYITTAPATNKFD